LALANCHGPASDKLSLIVLALDKALKSSGEPFAGLSPERYAAARSGAHDAIARMSYAAPIPELVTLLLCASNYLGECLNDARHVETGQ
jgi:hypothetical protein